MIINYHNITYPDMNNGSGLRVVLWCSSCSHHCKGCQNPQTWDANSGIPFDEKAKEELFRELDKDYISGLTLSGGDPLNEINLDDVLNIVTEFNIRYKNIQYIAQNEDKNNNILIKNTNKTRISLPDKNIWLYSGYSWDQVMNPIITGDLNFKKDEVINKRKEIVSQCDVFIDGVYIDSLRDPSLKWRGSKNQRVIDVQKSLQQKEVVLYCE